MDKIRNRVNRQYVKRLTKIITYLKQESQQTYDLPFSYRNQDGQLYRSAASMYVHIVKIMRACGYSQFADLAKRQVSFLVDPPFDRDVIQIARNAGRLSIAGKMQAADQAAERLSSKSADNVEIKDARGTDASIANERLRPLTAGDTKALIKDAICYVHYVYDKTCFSIENGQLVASLPSVDLRKFRAYANVIEQYRYLKACEQAEKHASQKTA